MYLKHDFLLYEYRVYKPLQVLCSCEDNRSKLRTFISITLLKFVGTLTENEFWGEEEMSGANALSIPFLPFCGHVVGGDEEKMKSEPYASAVHGFST